MTDETETEIVTATVEGLKEGYIADFVSGLPVKDGPEEREAVQVFSRALVEDYGYPKSHLQTRPQFRVKVRPSDKKKEYPVDIAVFADDSHNEDDVQIVVECKRKTRSDGRSQLQDYLRFCKAQIGVWFNGKERLYLRKLEKGGKVLFEEIPNIPRFGQRLQDVGHFKRSDLRPARNLKSTFKAIRNYLAANAVGATRDEVFAQQLINLIFCKIYDERFTKPDDMVSFRAGIDEAPKDVAKRIKDLFELVKGRYSDVIEKHDAISLDERSVSYIVGELQIYSITESDRDAVGEAFEVFIGPSLKGGQGQFFTPRNVVQMVIEMVDPRPGERIIDPACGSGGFLVETLRYLWKDVDAQGEALGWPQREIESEKQKVAISCLRGIDKDAFLAKVAKAYLAILGDGRGGIFCENSLESFQNWHRKTQDEVRPESFDVILTNPPFGKKLAIDSEELLRRYALGHSWKKSEESFARGDVLDKQSPQILFIERCLQLLKPGGRMGIVLLESIFGMPKYKYVVDWLKNSAQLKAIVTLPEDLFQPNTHAKTCVVILQKNPPSDESSKIFMCDVKWCGHDSRGNPTWTTNQAGKREIKDEIPLVAGIFRAGPAA